MNSLPDRRRLLAFSDSRQRRCEQIVLRTQQQLLPLRQALEGFVDQQHALQSLLASHHAEDCVLDHWQLLALLRRQAVIRRQIQELHLERDRVDQQCKQFEQSLSEQREQLHALQLKHGKYERSVQHLMRAQRHESVRREERDIEDMTGVRR